MFRYRVYSILCNLFYEKRVFLLPLCISQFFGPDCDPGICEFESHRGKYLYDECHSHFLPHFVPIYRSYICIIIMHICCLAPMAQAFRVIGVNCHEIFFHSFSLEVMLFLMFVWFFILLTLTLLAYLPTLLVYLNRDHLQKQWCGITSMRLFSLFKLHDNWLKFQMNHGEVNIYCNNISFIEVTI